MQSRLFLLLIKPSFVSLVTVIIAAAAVTMIVNGSYFTYNEALYPVLYGEFGAITALERSPGLVEGVIEGFSTNPIIYGIIVFIAAIIAGWVVFLVIHAIRSGKEAVETPDRHTVIQRAIARTVVGIMWSLYLFASVVTLIPIDLLYSRIGAEAILTLEGALFVITSYLGLAIILHVHIIFARLFLLRPRVFGGKIALEEAAFPAHHV
jgi:hypothetical protein